MTNYINDGAAVNLDDLRARIRAAHEGVQAAARTSAVRVSGRLRCVCGRVIQAGEIVAEVEAQVLKEGTAVVPCAQLLGILAGMTGDVTLTAGDGLAVQHGRSRFKVPTLPAADFPNSLAVDEGASCWQADEADIDRLAVVAGAMAQEETRYFLNGTYIHAVDDHLAMVATDGHRLTLITTAISYCGPGGIVPAGTVDLIVKLFGAGAGFSMDRKVIEVSGGNLRLTSKLIDGTFPDYTRAVPKPSGNAVTVDAGEIAATLKRLACSLRRQRTRPASRRCPGTRKRPPASCGSPSSTATAATAMSCSRPRPAALVSPASRSRPRRQVCSQRLVRSLLDRASTAEAILITAPDRPDLTAVAMLYRLRGSTRRVMAEAAE